MDRASTVSNISSNLLFRTGKVPVNAETPPNVVWEHDITPTENFYVRCHGTPPDLQWDTHSIDIYCDETRVHQLSVDELESSFPPQVMPITVVCDGNRRKELNIMKRTNGFDWGCCAISTGLFKGVFLRDIIHRYFDENQLASGRYVLFESADRLTQGHYGTSIPLPSVLHDTSDVLVVYGMNGEKLTPNHGYPVRTILPGCVGGRSVKWLSKITLATKDSDNHYHLRDNCVFPPDVTSIALMSKTVTEYDKQYQKESSNVIKPRHPFILYELNLNSVILSPFHSEIYHINEQSLQLSYTMRGYAYDGGGRKVIRVEITVDDGETWNQCDVLYPQDYEPQHGFKWYVMCKWEISLPVWTLAISKHIKVRAWNQSVNTQPEKHNWNILGMMNNSWYTIHINRKSANAIEFLHPVSLDINCPQGWMETKFPTDRCDEKQVPLVQYTRENVRQHNSISDCWVVINNKVYDLTDFLNLHPGGQASIAAHAGEDATVPFYDIHSDVASAIKGAYVIGTVAKEEGDATSSQARNPFLGRKHPRVTPDGHEIDVSPFKWIDVTLKEKIVVNHDVRRFIFALSSPEKRVWLPWGKHFNLGIVLSDRMVVRPYTPVKPIHPNEDNGTFELLIKVYYPTETRPGGEMTQLLDELNIGDIVKVKGPEGTLWYLGNGQFSMHGHLFYCAHMNFIVGGTGITPALAIIRAVVLAEKQAKIQAQIRLVFANKTLQDIFCQPELDEILSAHNDIVICHVISQGDINTDREREKFVSGMVNASNLGENILLPSAVASCFLCGPPAMIAKAVLPALTELGFDEDQIFEF
jgi:nitrate reductase (NAD(P)H)